MKKYFVNFNYNVGSRAGTPGGNKEWGYDVPGHLGGQALTARLKKALEAAGAPRVDRDIESIG